MERRSDIEPPTLEDVDNAVTVGFADMQLALKDLRDDILQAQRELDRKLDRILLHVGWALVLLISALALAIRIYYD